MTQKTMKTISLDGAWRLSGRLELPDAQPVPSFDSAEFRFDDACVPGNIELELERHGLVPEIFYSVNSRALRKYEFYEYLYEREFECSLAELHASELLLEGADCLCTVFLNGERLGTTENALVEHRLPCRELLRDGTNHIAIHFAAAPSRLQSLPLPAGAATPFTYNQEALFLRKPAHGFGWDISPRCCIGGLWRSVSLVSHATEEIEELFLDTTAVTAEHAALNCYVKLRSEEALRRHARLVLRLSGRCGESQWSAQLVLWTYAGRYPVGIEKPLLWNPRNYGEPNLYEVTAELMTPEGELLATRRETIGIRTIELRCKETATSSPEPDFQFVVNGVPVRLWGTNHVPADAMHSRDAAHYGLIFDNLRELGCSMVRIWGGGVYESDDFFDRCDREGILVWQDFMMGCAVYPCDDPEFQKAIRAEAMRVVQRLRRHPSLALWCGDNECDLTGCWIGLGKLDPNENALTRKILPETCRFFDPHRPYLPSSPYISSAALEMSRRSGKGRMECAPEQHLWFQQERPESPSYTRPTPSFISEIGRMGSPSLSSLKRFLSPEALWPGKDSAEWMHHCAMPYLPDGEQFLDRHQALLLGVERFLDAPVGNLQEFVCASQIYQAEAMKFLVERQRINHKCSGLLWWNLKDAAPLFSDAAVDYYGRRKLVWHYLRQLGAGFAGVLQLDGAKAGISFVNDCSAEVAGTYTLEDGGSNAEIASGTFCVHPRQMQRLDVQASTLQDCTLCVLRWRLPDGRSGLAHHLKLNADGRANLAFCLKHLVPLYVADPAEVFG